MKRHRIFSYILMFLIIGMCVRNLHYVYALDEEEISVSLENAEEAGDGSESVETPDGEEGEPPQEEPPQEEPPQEETPGTEDGENTEVTDDSELPGEPDNPEQHGEAGTGEETGGETVPGQPGDGEESVPGQPGDGDEAGGPDGSAGTVDKPGSEEQTPAGSGQPGASDGEENQYGPDSSLSGVQGADGVTGLQPGMNGPNKAPEVPSQTEEPEEEVSEILVNGGLFTLSGEPEAATVGEGFTIRAEVKIEKEKLHSLQWQISPDGSDTDWQDIEGENEEEYSFVPEEGSFAAFYRLVATDTDNQRYASTAFQLTRAVYEIEETGDITLSGDQQAALEGYPFTILAEVGLSDIEAYQWQSFGDGESWEDIEGAEEKDYEFTADESCFTTSYRLVATATDGRRYASSAFTPKRAICYIVTEPMTRAAEAYVPISYSDLQEAVDDVQEENGTIYLMDDVEISETIEVGGHSSGGLRSCTITSAPETGARYTLSRATEDAMFSVSTDAGLASLARASLTLDNVVLDGKELFGEEAMIKVHRNATVTLEADTILQNGKNETAAGNVQGGAVYIQDVETAGYEPGKLVMEEGVVIQNCSAPYGGAIYVDSRPNTTTYTQGEDGILEIKGGTIKGNSATNDGGRIYAAGSTRITVSNCDFERNTAASSGGAVFMTAERNGDETAKFTNCTFKNNETKAAGGAILVYGHREGDVEELNSEKTNVYLKDCTIDGNSAYSGGGVSADCWSTVTVENTSITNNTAGNAGGGIFTGDATKPGRAKIISGTISGNKARFGKGIHTGGGVSPALILGKGDMPIRMEDEICLFNQYYVIQVVDTDALWVEKGFPVKITFKGFAAPAKGSTGIRTIEYAEGETTDRECMKYEAVNTGTEYGLTNADKYDFIREADIEEASGNKETNWINLVVAENPDPWEFITHLYVHSELGIDPTNAQIRSRALPFEYGTEKQPLKSLYMAYYIASIYYSEETVAIHLMDTQELGKNGVPTEMTLSAGSYKDNEDHEVADVKNTVSIVRHDASSSVDQFSGSDGVMHENVDNTGALFKVGAGGSLTLTGALIVDGENLALTGDDSALVCVDGGTLTVSEGAVLQDNTYRAIRINGGNVTLDSAEIKNNTVPEKADGTEGEGSGIWQAAGAALTIKGTNTIPENQEIWLNAANSDSADGAMLTVTGDLTLTDGNQLSVDFPNYVGDRKIAVYTDGTNPPDEAEAAKYKVDTTKLVAGLNVGAEDQYP